MTTSLSFYTPDASIAASHPLFSVSVAAGSPCPADEHSDQLLDLNEHLIDRPQATFFVKVQGESMIDAGIHDGDLLVVDRALTPRDHDVIIAQLFGEFTVKRIRLHHTHILLMPENPAYQPITVTPDMDCSIWGVVTNVIHSLR